MAKRRTDLTLSKKLDILKNYQALPKCSQRTAAEQLKILLAACETFCVMK